MTLLFPFPKLAPAQLSLVGDKAVTEVHTDMDETASFFHQLDSEDLLKKHGPSLATEAREVIGIIPDAKVAGLITTTDSPDTTAVLIMLANATGAPVPNGLLVGIVPRQFVEGLLVSRVPQHLWREEPWQHQQVLPVVVSTRDGRRFGFFPLHTTATEAE